MRLKPKTSAETVGKSFSFFPPLGLLSCQVSLESEMATCPPHEGQLPEREANMRKAAGLRDRDQMVPLGVLGQA